MALEWKDGRAERNAGRSTRALLGRMNSTYDAISILMATKKWPYRPPM
jgi:hypothetical protein